MAERKMSREKKLMTLEKLLGKSGENDIVLKNSIKRTKQNNKMEEESDQNLQDMVGAMKGMAQFAYGTGKNGVMKYATGGPVIDWGALLKSLNQPLIPNMTGTSDDFHTGDPVIDYPSSKSPSLTTPDFNPAPETGEGDAPELPREGFKLPNFTSGDLVGLAGTIYSAFEPMKNTHANRAGDTPNINAFEDLGNDALDRVEEAKGYVAGQRDKALRDLEIGRTRSSSRNRNSARGVNTQRALDLATDVNINNAQSDIYDNFAKQMMQLVGQQAGFENQQDQAVMAGEQQRDLADRQDRDNYYSQLAQDISTKGQGIQTIGKMLNQNKFNTAAEQAVNDSSINFQYDNGVLKDKAGNVVMNEAEIVKAAKAIGVTPEEYINLVNSQ